MYSRICIFSHADSIQRDRSNMEDYRELAFAIMDIMTIMKDEMQAVESHERSKYWAFCVEFNEYVIIYVEKS
jgi:hypothetical protein